MRRYVKWIAPVLLGAVLSAPMSAMAATEAQLCTASQVKHIGKYVNNLIKTIANACQSSTFGANGVRDISYARTTKITSKLANNTMDAANIWGRAPAAGVLDDSDGDCPIDDPNNAVWGVITPTFTHTIATVVFSVVCP